MNRSMVRFRGVALCGVLQLLVGVAGAAAPNDEARQTFDASLAPGFVSQALQAEAAGKTEERAELLQHALRADAGSEAAHWQVGEVRIGDRWLPIETASEETSRAGDVDEYRRRRDQVRTADDHVKLAQWCAEQGLDEQERLHLVLAARMGSKSPEIVKRLRLTRYRGTWMTRAQAEVIARQTKQTDDAVKKSKARLGPLMRAIDGGNLERSWEAARELKAIDDPRLVPGLEAIINHGSEASGQAAVAALANIRNQPATDSLVRSAVFARQKLVRTAAARALAERSMYGYVPTLLSAMDSPVDVQFDTFLANGHFCHQLTLIKEGLLANTSWVSTGGTSTDIVFSRNDGDSIQIHPDKTYVEDAERASQEDQNNFVRRATNERVADALRAATDNRFDANPTSWWNWWLDYNDYYRPPYKPVEHAYRNAPIAPNLIRYSSCFVAGTKVWTSTGPMPIEQVRIGDCVLAQNPETGELAHKPVVTTTVRPASPLVEIHVGGETIRATRGHPFWVSGMGWRMAKELESQQWLHTAHGAKQIDSVESAEPEVCYNMVVADFNTYFISDQQVLVHDNTLRQVTAAIVPGLIVP